MKREEKRGRPPLMVSKNCHSCVHHYLPLSYDFLAYNGQEQRHNGIHNANIN